MNIKTLFIAAAMLTLSAAPALADDEAAVAKKYVDARELRIINRAFNDTERFYARLPRDIRDSIGKGRNLWDRQECSAGIAIRFATDSRSIGIRYELFWDTHMIHMADTGLKGTDLYILEGDSVWRHVNTVRPYVKKDSNGKKTKVVESTYVERLDGEMHEYIIYLPLYDGVQDNVLVVVDSTANLTPGNREIIDSKKRVVAYGTSIMQGGCASRTGMAYTNIIGRELNCEVMNLGFSGEGKMDTYMAHALTRIPDVDVFLLDPVPNCTEKMCDTLTYNFVKILRDARPDVPIVMVEGPLYPYARYDSMFKDYLPAKNAAYRRNYERLKAENPDNLYYVTNDNLDGVEDDGTVDGIHLTDLGFRHYADKMVPVLRPLLYPDNNMRSNTEIMNGQK